MLKPYNPTTATDKPFLDPERAVSWSMISSYKFNKDKWWFKYVYHGKCTKEFCMIANEVNEFCPVVETSPEMTFGKEIGHKLETDPTYLPQVPRQIVMEYKLSGMWKNMKLIGYADSLDDVVYFLEEYKTGRNAWTQKKADDHEQITLYLLVLYLTKGIRPESFQNRLHWLPTMITQEGKIQFVDPFEHHTFYTTRTLAQCLDFANYIEKVYKEMNEYAENHQWPVINSSDV